MSKQAKQLGLLAALLVVFGWVVVRPMVQGDGGLGPPGAGALGAQSPPEQVPGEVVVSEVGQDQKKVADIPLMTPELQLDAHLKEAQGHFKAGKLAKKDSQER